MPELEILTAPDPRLKTKCLPVAEVDDEIRLLMNDMLTAMYGANGIGLAAPQVNVHKRIIVIDVSPKEQERDPIRMVNPEIVEESGEQVTKEEGCLSLPDQWADVTRPAAVTVRYMDETGKAQRLRADGVLATCVQHEMDHLDGVLFVDHVSALKRNMILRKLQKAKKTGG
ncbi:peptide deformylase [Magnetospira sp. QH-2]|uniref:peptide deformylase n=1 Tax=Magnetospira sp. (strain QH-2) TaxID=1288970 RepID=UPI0003E810CC|nr:peptide deformylase [Magnetospira sp. QH-2]CCQ72238.1 Peptide deformylase (PDF) (Polypeptide deformylase) [Magnetospira sp. QH-2]